MPRVGVLAAGVFIALVVVTSAAAQLAERSVLASSLDEETPFATWNAAGTVDYLAYSKNSSTSRNRYHAYLRVAKHTATGTSVSTVTLNTIGSGWAGGGDGVRVAYQQVVNGQSDLRLYNIATKTRSLPPAGVNTTRWEWHPSVSGDWLLFGRTKYSYPRADQVILVNLATHETRIVDSAAGPAFWPGEVRGDYAVWARCLTLCNVFVYRISTAVKTKLARPTPDGDDPEDQWGPSVTATGTVYAVRAVSQCDSTKIVRFGPSDPATGTELVTLPAGRTINFTSARRNAGSGGTDVFYDRFNCNTGYADIYRITDP